MDMGMDQLCFTRQCHPVHPKCPNLCATTGAPGRALGTAGMSAQCPLQLVSSPHSFIPSFLRLSSWNVVMFISYEQLQRAVALAWPAQS